MRVKSNARSFSLVRGTNPVERSSPFFCLFLAISGASKVIDQDGSWFGNFDAAAERMQL